MIYRLKADVPGRDDMKAGQLVFGAKNSADGPTGPRRVTTQGDGYGISIDLSRDYLAPAGDFQAGDFSLLFDYFLHARAPLPNYAPEDTDTGLAAIAGSSGNAVWPTLASVIVPGNPGVNPFDTGPASPRQEKRTWARVFLGTTQAGAYDGTAIVILYVGSHEREKIAPLGRFRLCDHNRVEGAGARPMRGWHPGRCSKCGLDMSVDSGD
jgi:hypothetical protein